LMGIRPDVFIARWLATRTLRSRRSESELARLLGDQDKRAEAHDLLAPVHNWFTERFDTIDLKKAKALPEAARLT
jgi:hypothetical protein